MDYLENQTKDEVFDKLFKAVYGNRIRQDIFPEGCNENLNISYRRFMLISCIDSLLNNIKYEKYWPELQELSNKALHADSCDVLFPVLKETTQLVTAISELR